MEPEESCGGNADHGVLGVGNLREQTRNLGAPGMCHPERLQSGLWKRGLSPGEVADPALEGRQAVHGLEPDPGMLADEVLRMGKEREKLVLGSLLDFRPVF